MSRSAKLASHAFFSPVFRVYEHELLRVGDELDGTVFTEHHLESLLHLSSKTENRYFTPGHRSVRFKHFVGMLVTPQLQVEILPKLDRLPSRSAAKWQGVLIDMLRSCHLVRPESTGNTQLDLRPGDLLEWYLRIFAAELNRLLRQGLLHVYAPVENNGVVLKGRLRFAQQIKHNYIRKDRFFVQYDEYTDRHPANLMLGAAIRLVRHLPLSPDLQAKLNDIGRFFPVPDKGKDLSGLLPDHFFSDHRLLPYMPALKIAQHILQQQLPDVRAGAQHGLALLFDMNLLFEAYLYRQLLQWKPPDVQVTRQQSRVFWGQNRLRPDLVLSSANQRWVLDTKWRLLQSRLPDADELRQIYVYCDYFQADRGVLIFPQADADDRPQLRQFAPLPGNREQHRSCQVYFARVIKENGQLNPELGKELYAALEIN